MRNIILLAAIVLISFSAFAQNNWDYQRNETFFNNLEMCRSNCSELCSSELALAKDIKLEYEAVCFDGQEPNFNYFHYCGYQCTNVCRIQTQAIMASAIKENQQLCD